MAILGREAAYTGQRDFVRGRCSELVQLGSDQKSTPLVELAIPPVAEPGNDETKPLIRRGLN